MTSPLGKREQAEFSVRLRELAGDSIPLSAGLRVAADEASSRRLSRALRRLGEQIEAGKSLEELLDDERLGLPPYVVGMIKAGVASGDLARVLDGLIDQQRSRVEIWRQIWWSLAYPVTILVMAAGVFLLALLLVVRPLQRMFQEFDTALPPITQVWIAVAEYTPIGAAVAMMVLLFVLGGIRLVGGPVGWARFLCSLPMIGPMFLWAGTAQMSRILKVLLRQHMGLPDALRLTADGVSNANTAAANRWLAKGVEDGIPLNELMDATIHMPAEIVPVIRWGEMSNSLDEAFESAHELLEGHVRLRASLLRIILSPVLYIIAAALIGSMVVGMFMPLVSLIQNLA